MHLVLATILIFTSCQSIEKSDIVSVQIKVSDNSPVNLSEIAEKVFPVNLETTELSLINRIISVEILNNYIYIWHDFKNELLMFNLNGEFVKQVGRMGKGPGEYIGIHGMTANAENNILIINKTGIMTFYINGNFVQNHKVNVNPNYIYFHNRNLYCLSNYFNQNSNNVLLTVYKDYSIVDSFLVKKHKSNWWPTIRDNFLSKSKNSIYVFYPDVDSRYYHKKNIDTLFVVKNHELEPVFEIKFENDNSFNSVVTSVNMTDNYLVIKYITRIDNQSTYSHYYLKLETMIGKNVQNGFIDDFYNTGNVLITPIPNNNLFFYTKETDYSENMILEQNPILYIGTFK